MTRPDLKSLSPISIINIQQYERYNPSAFNDSLSILQKINKVIFQLNEIGELSNSLVSQWNAVMEWIIGNGLSEIVSAEIDKRIADGTFDNLFNEILGNIANLETVDKTTIVNAINEINRIALENKENIGDMTLLTTYSKENLVEAINEIKFQSNINEQAVITIGEATGYGVISGLKVRQQSVLAMAVEVGDNVTPNIIHMKNGARYTPQSIALPVNPSSSILDRKDIIYVSELGEISYLSGNEGLNPVVPDVPNGGQLLAVINVSKGDTTVNDIDIEDKRKIKNLTSLKTNEKANFVVAINEVIDLINELVINALQDIDSTLGDKNLLNVVDKSTFVSAINEVIANIGNNNNLNTTQKVTIVGAINEVLTILGDKNTINVVNKNTFVSAINEVIQNIGDNTLLNTTEKLTIVSAINEVLNNVGNLLNLNTTDKQNIVSAINEVIANIGRNLDLNTTDKTIVGAINELLNTIGNSSLLDTTNKSNIVSSINELVFKIGDLTLLNTVTKDTIVNAINELVEANANGGQVVNEKIKDLNDRIGENATLKTTDKTTIVNAMNEIFDDMKKLNSYVYSLIFDVKVFGAKGDGTTDDTITLLNVAQAIKLRGGGIMYFPKGVYIISESIVLGENTMVIGENSESTYIKASNNYVPTAEGMLLFKYDTNHCHGVSVKNISFDGNNQNTHVLVTYSAYDSVIFENIIIDNVGEIYNAFRIVPHPILVSTGKDPVSQTIIMDNCMALASKATNTGSLFYFDCVQEMNMRGCKAFCGRDYPMPLRSKRIGFEFVDCRGVIMDGCSVALSDSTIYPITIRVAVRDSNGFVINGTTFESVAKLIHVKGTATYLIDNVYLTNSRNEASGGSGDVTLLENVRNSHFELIVGGAKSTNVIDTNIVNFKSFRYFENTFIVNNEGIDTLNVTYPWTPSDTCLTVMTNAGGVRTLKKVQVGEVDSGGVGYRTLVVQN